MRLFTGIGLSAECRRAIAEATGPLRRGNFPVSWVPENNMHITLKFLGETPPDRLGEIGERLAAAAREIPTFSLSLEGGGTFPAGKAPRVLWAGVREPLELVGKLHENIGNALSSAGFPREGRRFHPHVTVGRVRGELSPAWGERFVASVAGKSFGEEKVTSFKLYESRLQPAGAVYAVVGDFTFGRGDDQ